VKIREKRQKRRLERIELEKVEIKNKEEAKEG
jgi:hypothetical protein